MGAGLAGRGVEAQRCCDACHTPHAVHRWCAALSRRYPLIVDTEEDADTLCCQVFSLTGVDPGHQRLFCESWPGPLPPDTGDLRTPPHALKDGDVLVLWPPHDTGAQPQAPGMLQQLAMYQDMTDGHRLTKIAALAGATPAHSLQGLLGRCQGAAR